MSGEGQVSLSRLLFTQSWEDPRCDLQALAIRPGDVVMGVTSGACNIFGLLLADPGLVYAVDINPCQSWLLELKIAALRRLEHPALLEFLGLRPSGARLDQFHALAPDLSPEARTYWLEHRNWIIQGLLGQGRYERFVGLVRGCLKVLQGPGRVQGLFASNTLDQQRDYFAQRWDTRRWRWVFDALLNKVTLARMGLSKDYFQFDDGSQSFSESFRNRCKRALTEIPIHGNYFVSLYFSGTYADETSMPDYLLPQNIATLRARLDRIRIVTQDVQGWLERQPDRSIDGFSLSNICELMDQATTDFTFEQVARTGKVGAGICFRNLMIRRGVPASLAGRIQRQDALSESLLRNDRSFVYSKVDALRVIS